MNTLSCLLLSPIAWLARTVQAARAGELPRGLADLEADDDAREHVRAEMLARLGRCDGAQAAMLRVRIQRADDVHALWHLRVRLMQLLAAQYGESDARRSLAGLDAAIREHWPEAPVSRPAPLH